MRKTATHRLADLLLDQPLAEFVAERRARGESWRLIARAVYTLTDGQVDVTAETLRTWFSERGAA